MRQVSRCRSRGYNLQASINRCGVGIGTLNRLRVGPDPYNHSWLGWWDPTRCARHVAVTGSHLTSDRSQMIQFPSRVLWVAKKEGNVAAKLAAKTLDLGRHPTTASEW